MTYGANGAAFSISQAGQAPSLISNNYLFFGTVDVTMQVAKGKGILTTFFLSGDSQDEIDWEFLGGDDKNSFGQSNYFSSHNMAYGVNEIDVNVASPQTEMHTYTIDWSPTQLVWKVDGVAMRTLPYAGNENTYPQTPMQVKLGTWCGGCSDSQGTVEWAGGPPDWSAAPFVASYKSVTIQDSSNGVANAVSYQYTDTSGSMKGIKVNTGAAGSTEAGGSNSDGNGKAPSVASSSAVSSSSIQSAATTQETTPTVSGAGAPGGPDSGSNNASSTASGAASTLVQTTAKSSSTLLGSQPTGSTTGSSSTSSGQTSPVVSGGKKSGVNAALLCAFMFALCAL